MRLVVLPKAITAPIAQVLARFELADPFWTSMMHAFVLTDDDCGIIPLVLEQEEFAIVPNSIRGDVSEAEIDGLKRFMAEQGYAYAEY